MGYRPWGRRVRHHWSALAHTLTFLLGTRVGKIGCVQLDVGDPLATGVGGLPQSARESKGTGAGQPADDGDGLVPGRPACGAQESSQPWQAGPLASGTFLLCPQSWSSLGCGGWRGLGCEGATQVSTQGQHRGQVSLGHRRLATCSGLQELNVERGRGLPFFTS